MYTISGRRKEATAVNKKVVAVVEEDKNKPTSWANVVSKGSPKLIGPRKDIVSKTAHEKTKSVGRGDSLAQAQGQALSPSGKSKGKARGMVKPDLSNLSTVENMNLAIGSLPPLPETPDARSVRAGARGLLTPRVLIPPPNSPMTPITKVVSRNIETPKSSLGGFSEIDQDLVEAGKNSSGKKKRNAGRGKKAKKETPPVVGRGRAKSKLAAKGAGKEQKEDPKQHSIEEYMVLTPRRGQSPKWTI